MCKAVEVQRWVALFVNMVKLNLCVNKYGTYGPSMTQVRIVYSQSPSEDKDVH